MLEKKDIINFLYLISFPVYGLGLFVSGNISPTIGYVVGVSAHIAIIFFYIVDLLYKSEFKVRINGYYFIMLLYLLSTVVSLAVSLNRDKLHGNAVIMYTKALMLVIPFQAFIAVFLYNEKDPEKVAKLTFRSLSYLLLINLVAFFGLGLKNAVHSIEGRINFPLMDGLYSGACMLAIINLMILYYIRRSWDDPVRVAGYIIYFLFNLVLIFFINSRLTIMVFIIVFLLFAFNVSKSYRGLFPVALFTIPILLNAGLLVYRILSLPVFVFIMQRVNLADVTTFNGRALVWQRALDWLMYDQRNVIFGNGANGHHYLHLMPDIAKMWGVSEATTHLHSTVLMVLVDQGIVGYALLVILFYKLFTFYRRKFRLGSQEGMLFSVVIFMLLVMQIDTFVYLDGLGMVIFGLLMARACLTDRSPAVGHSSKETSIFSTVQISS